MYLTAHRVVANNKNGINIFLHLHTNGEQPVMNSISTIALVAEKNTGTIVDDNCDLLPGGNRVKSYVDIVANDNISQDDIKNAINAVKTKISSVELPFQEIISSVGIRFGAEIGLYDMIVQEYDDLTNAAMMLFSKWQSKKY
jgi:hypothetical protein